MKLNFFIILSITLMSLVHSQSQIIYYKFPNGINENDCYQGIIIAKVKENFKEKIKNKKYDSALTSVFNYLNVFSFDQVFPKSQPPLTKKDMYGRKLVDLTSIYQINYNSNVGLEEAVNVLYSTGYFEYVEPYYIPTLMHVPNDPMIVYQYALRVIKAFDAWNVSKGDTNVVIGISDTGFDLSHPDLRSNIKYNWYDPIDGFDNDNDGYVDNFRGWDFANWDNNPSYTGNCSADPHGSLVAGLAAAATNNGIGVASPGYRCKFLPLKIMNDNYCTLQKTYESIVYAVDHGCSIVNCSWGSGAFSNFGQDVINYATINKNALVVCAGGNTGTEVYFYPASYENSLSVAFTDSLDCVTDNTTFNDKIDICAPGEAVYSTNINGTYSYCWASSMASPIVAGIAGVVKSKYPQFIGIQIGELLKATADIIDTIPQNSPFAGKLGSGRVNMLRALTELPRPSLDIVDVFAYDNNDSILVNNDTVLIKLSIINYLAPASDVRVFLNSQSQYITEFINPWAIFGNIGTMETKTNSNNPFRIKLANTPLTNCEIPITATIVANNYSVTKKFNIKFNIDYVNINSSRISTTLTSIGRFAYTDLTYKNGQGFSIDGSQSLTSMMGIICGNDPTRVSDVIYNSPITLDNDFKMEYLPHRVTTPQINCDFQYRASYSDSIAGINRVGISVIQNVYVWNNPDDAKYLISEYLVINKKNTPITNFYFGLYSNWDIIDFKTNRASFDPDFNLGYVYSIYDEYYTGIQLLYPLSVKYYAMDNDGSYGSIGLNQFTSAKKFSLLKGSRFNAGQDGNGNDVSHYIGAGPVTISPLDTSRFVFAIIAGTSLIDLQISAFNAMNKFNSLFINESKLNKSDDASLIIFPNPSNNKIFVKKLTEKILSVRLYNINGVIIEDFTEKYINSSDPVAIDISNIKSGIYLIKVTSEQKTYIKKIVKN